MRILASRWMETGACVFLCSCLMCLDLSASEDKMITRKSDTVEGYTLSVETQNDTYRIGDKISVRVRLKNVSEDTVRIRQATPFRTFDIELKLPDGKKAPLTLFGQRVLFSGALGSKSARELKPSEEYESSFNLSRIFDMTLAGKYDLTVSKKVWIRDGGTKTKTVSSPSLTISVTEE